MKNIFLIVFAFILLGLALWIMYFLSANDWNRQGGFMFMIVLNILFIVNVGLIIYSAFALIQGRPVDARLFETIKQIGGLAAAWGTWSTILGLFFAFDAIEAEKEIIPFQVICGGLKVAVITVLYGLIIFCHALIAYIGLNLSKRAAA
jgi:hypothetical protein